MKNFYKSIAVAASALLFASASNAGVPSSQSSLEGTKVKPSDMFETPIVFDNPVGEYDKKMQRRSNPDVLAQRHPWDDAVSPTTRCTRTYGSDVQCSGD